MTKTFEYYCEEDNCHYTITVKQEFFDICPHPHMFNGVTLTDKFHVRDFLHCLSGPAITNHTLNGYTSYWINGAQCPTKAIWKELVEQMIFDNKIETLVNEGEHYGTS